jgi:uncharacterized repeat protein (TIGR01451 family)
MLFLILSLSAFPQDIIALQKMKSFVAENKTKLGVSDADIATLSLTHEYTDESTGIHHAYATQKLNGLVIANSHFALHSSGSKNFDAGEIISLKKYSVKQPTAAISSSNAVIRLMDEIHYTGEKKFEIKQAPQGTDQVTTYKRNASSIWDIPVRLVYYNNEKVKSLQPAWEIQMMDVYKKHYWLAYVDASTGKVLEKRDLILHCDFGGPETDINPVFHGSHKHHFQEATTGFKEEQKEKRAIITNSYRVYDLPLESPGDTVQQAAPHSISNRSGDTIASPDGWHRVNNNTVIYQYTRGNNVWTFQDPLPAMLGGAPSADPTRTAYNNGGVGGTPSAAEPFVFDYPVDLNQQPEAYQKGAIVNLFYWNNLMHDVFYRLGFTEPAGNFQESHVFSNGTRAGGLPGDAVLAQAQDGGGTNNANFLTPQDGASGQMQMYLWTAAFPDSLVQIISSTTGVPPAGQKYIAVQGSFNSTDTARQNLFRNPVVNKEFVIVKKNSMSTVGKDSEGCSSGQQSIALRPDNDVTDKIVLIDRGSCSFVEKVSGAQMGGAAGVIVINNADGPPQAMGGTDAPGATIVIPAVMISKADGEILKAQIAAGAVIRGSLKRDSPPTPKRDGDLDNGVIAHEYGHGISSRMTAPNTTGTLGGSEQGGEGWSDYFALYMSLRINDLVADPSNPNGKLPTRSIGNYVTYQQAEGRGIRPTPYSLNRSINPSTFKDIGKGGEITIPHGVGYIWCTMLYELTQRFIDRYGMGDNLYEGAAPTSQKNPPAEAKGNNIAMRLVMEGIKLQGRSPTFVKQRDAILKADTILYNAQHSCMIWEAFASRGLGVSALSNTNAVGDEFEAFDVPLTCNPNQKRIRIDKSGPIKGNNGSTITYNISVTNLYQTPTSVLVTDTLRNGLSFVSASDNPTMGDVNNLSWNLNLAGNETRVINLVTQLNSSGSSIMSFGDDHEASGANWVATIEPAFAGPDVWTRRNDATKAFSGSFYWHVPDPDGFAHTSLKTTNPINIPPNAELVFIHKFATEVGFDGGIVEVSEDNVNWSYIPPTAFVKGGYNGVIPATNNPAFGANSAAFTGSSGGYIASVARLTGFENKSLYIRFRFSSDVGTGVEGGGWFMDDVYILVNRTEISNAATAVTTEGSPTLMREGANARSTETTAFVLGGSTLPGTISSLTATVVRQSVNLSWRALSEVNTVKYQLERKAPGETEFTKIAEIAATRGGTQASDYKYNDPNVSLGNRYQYRVKQVERDGRGYYTNIAVVSLGAKAFAATIYPNPAKNVATLSITNPTGRKVTINLFDVLGKRLVTFIGAEAQNLVIPLPVQQLQPGTYWIEIIADDERKTLKLEVTK